MTDLSVEGLSEQAREVAEAIVACAREHLGDDPHTGGCKAFYDPKNWKYDFSNNAVLMVAHDGGDFAPFFNWDYESYDLIESLSAYLEPLGYYAEQCTTWYSGIYPIEVNP